MNKCDAKYQGSQFAGVAKFLAKEGWRNITMALNPPARLAGVNLRKTLIPEMAHGVK